MAGFVKVITSPALGKNVGEGITIAFAPDDSPDANFWCIDGKQAWETYNRASWLKEFYDKKRMQKT